MHALLEDYFVYWQQYTLYTVVYGTKANLKNNFNWNVYEEQVTRML